HAHQRQRLSVHVVACALPGRNGDQTQTSDRPVLRNPPSVAGPRGSAQASRFIQLRVLPPLVIDDVRSEPQRPADMEVPARIGEVVDEEVEQTGACGHARTRAHFWVLLAWKGHVLFAGGGVVDLNPDREPRRGGSTQAQLEPQPWA